MMVEKLLKRVVYSNKYNKFLIKIIDLSVVLRLAIFYLSYLMFMVNILKIPTVMVLIKLCMQTM